MMECSCSIVVYNTNQKIVETTIKNLCRCENISEIFIIDNGGNIILEHLNQLCLESNKELYIQKTDNKGLSVAQNIVINNKKLSKYHLILNPDAYVNNDSLKNMIDYCDANQEIAALGPKIKYPSGKLYPSVKLIPGPLTHIARRLFPKGRKNRRYEIYGTKFTNPISVPMISGCFILTKSDYLIAIKGFDERFFLYFEDIDLLMRLRDYGEIHYFPNKEILHVHKDASRKSIRMMLYHFSSYIKYYNKWGWMLPKDSVAINSEFLKQNLNQ